MISSTNPNAQPDSPDAQNKGTTVSPAPEGEEQVVPQITQKQAERINAPARNMVISMVVMVLLLLPVLWLMPQPNKNPYRPSVDLPVVAYEASEQAGYPVVAAEQEGWHYNYARWVTGQADGINYWSTGQVTPANDFIELIQATGTNPTWVAQIVGQAVPEATVSAGGVTWDVRTLVDPDDREKITTFYIGEVEGTTVILKGEAEPTEFQALAEATVAYMAAPTATLAPTASSGIQ
ncbi:DUF4245 family protein [Rothia nasisuis]|uniref:DUF4245 family protein n=1 Tax=Rothia nasisuis TaxID=2109647 RepID=UPI001F4283D2|nr:DUF4245 family protein [Rothia nasisuis]